MKDAEMAMKNAMRDAELVKKDAEMCSVTTK